jgi:hydrogenase maturation protein HypF
MLERRRIAVAGVVQGVGFRPFVHRIASRRNLSGFVLNRPGGVVIEIEGEPTQIEDFCDSLVRRPPPLAAISTLHFESLAPSGAAGFLIAPSVSESGHAAGMVIPADVATCDDCLAELRDPQNRRYRYPFITCADCGPRFTIVNGVPFDRQRTSMAGFEMCAACRSEYENPDDRRFHAETVSCFECGPRLSAWERERQTVHDHQALRRAVAALCAGEIVAVKALGGYHLACDARDDAAVARLRRLKHREHKPLAVMVPSVESAGMFCSIGEAEQRALEGPQRPIIVARRSPASLSLAPSVAPGQDSIGIMLPSTPLHHILLAEVECPLVMTSANTSEEPVVFDDGEALQKLPQLADVILSHDRPIIARADDSVARALAGAVRPIRRSRGHVPGSIPLSSCRSGVLALGGHQKNTFCLTSDGAGHVSAHIGDLDSAASRDAFAVAVRDLVKLTGAQPAVVVRDTHPQYGSSLMADKLAAQFDVTEVRTVQHHHAHIASVVAERGIARPVLGVAFDGAGLGTDGAIWGGEFLFVQGAEYRRMGHLKYVGLPGGDSASRAPWKSAIAHLTAAGVPLPATFATEVPAEELKIVMELARRPGGSLSPFTSSVGRLFDAVASLAGICHRSRFESEAAMLLESAATGGPSSRYNFQLSDGDTWTADAAPLIEAIASDLARGRAIAEVASDFHYAVASMVLNGCRRMREVTGFGSVFMNAVLVATSVEMLEADDFEVFLPELVPFNDGGLSLGQAYVAAHEVS